MASFPLLDILTTLKDGVSRALRVKGEMETVSSSVLAIGAKTVGTSAIALHVGAANLTNRKRLHLKCIGSEPIYVGLASVTASSGYPIWPGQEKVFEVGSALTLYAIATEENQSIRIIEEA